MSKGLGSLQRSIIEVGGASKTIWQLGAPIPVRVAHDEEKEACGLRVRLISGTTWRKDGKPWFEARTKVSTREQFDTLAANFRSVDFALPDRNMTNNSHVGPVLAPLLAACISYDNTRKTLWPHLYSEEADKNNWQDEIKRGRNSARAGLSRALNNMSKRGLIVYLGIAGVDDCPELKDRWPLLSKPYSWHSLYLVLDDRAVHAPATATAEAGGRVTHG